MHLQDTKLARLIAVCKRTLKPLFQSSQKLARCECLHLIKKNSQCLFAWCEFFLIRCKYSQRAANRFLRWLEKRLKADFQSSHEGKQIWQKRGFKKLMLLLCIESRRKRREKYRKRFWVRPIFQKRTQLSGSFTLVKELRDGYHEGYFNYSRSQ